jgi:hypothetical protein
MAEGIERGIAALKLGVGHAEHQVAWQLLEIAAASAAWALSRPLPVLLVEMDLRAQEQLAVHDLRCLRQR